MTTKRTKRRMATLCSCGESFNPASPRQLYHSDKCRKLSYEQSNKARTRRSRYAATEKGKAVRQRYVASGKSAINSWRYYDKVSTAGWALLDARHKHKNGLEGLRPEQVWTKQEIADLNAYGLWVWLHRLRETDFKGMGRFKEFFRKLLTAKLKLGQPINPWLQKIVAIGPEERPFMYKEPQS